MALSVSPTTGFRAAGVHSGGRQALVPGRNRCSPPDALPSLAYRQQTAPAGAARDGFRPCLPVFGVISPTGCWWSGTSTTGRRWRRGGVQAPCGQRQTPRRARLRRAPASAGMRRDATPVRAAPPAGGGPNAPSFAIRGSILHPRIGGRLSHVNSYVASLNTSPSSPSALRSACRP